MTKYPSQMQDKFNLRFPEGMRDAVAESAKQNGRSMNSEIIAALEAWLNIKPYQLTESENSVIVSLISRIEKLEAQTSRKK
ncbi:Putative regulator protein; Arc-like DNA binding domain (fragment) [Xenorhabdus innexi]|uniref:Putative regulator protein Arc-like DNA binding domain n=1 Tax=Xenorhabdus innexi TaxID=290109 RepID=A0A1N6MWS5_9GAMM